MLPAPRDGPSDLSLAHRDNHGQDAADVSVVIPAYLGARTIADCLTSVERALAGRRGEIIVVESSGDQASDVVKQRFPNVLLVQSEHRLSAGAARNRGAEQARGRLFLFTDQDCIVPADWIDRLERHLQDPSVGAAGGAVGIRNFSNLSGCAVYFLEFLYHFPSSGKPRHNKDFLVGCNSAYRADVFQQVRFPDQTIGEDVLFTHRLRSHGFGVVYDPQIEVKHQNREGWGEFFNYNRKMGWSAASYHDVLKLWWIEPFFRAPLLAFLAPIVILPSVLVNLVNSRWSYLLRFLTLSPMCLVGNLVWANAFRRRALEIRRQQRSGDPGSKGSGAT